MKNLIDGNPRHGGWLMLATYDICKASWPSDTHLSFEDFVR